MPDFKAIWNFSEDNGATFSEQYYCSASDANAAALLGKALLNARLALLDSTITFIGTRSSSVIGNRVTSQQTYLLNGTFTNTLGPLQVGACAVLNLASAGGGSRRLWMRGLPSALVVRNSTTGQDQPPPTLKKLLDTFFQALADAGFGIRQLQKLNGASVQKQNITQVDGAANPGKSVITLTPANLLTVPGSVLIQATNPKDLPGLKGVFPIIAATANSVTIPYVTPQNLLIVAKQGYVKQALYQPVSTFVPLQCGFKYYGTRASKNPFSRSRGARRAVRLRTLA